MKHRASNLLRYCKKRHSTFEEKKIKNAKADFFDGDVVTVIYPTLKMKVPCENANPQ